MSASVLSNDFTGYFNIFRRFSFVSKITYIVVYGNQLDKTSRKMHSFIQSGFLMHKC